jgi:hypothetical protein
MIGSPSIVPETAERDIYRVLDDFRSLSAKHWREAGEDTARSTLVANLLDGEDHNPTRIIAFNTAEGWSRDVSEDVADELAERRAERGESGIKAPSPASLCFDSDDQAISLENGTMGPDAD